MSQLLCSTTHLRTDVIFSYDCVAVLIFSTHQTLGLSPIICHLHPPNLASVSQACLSRGACTLAIQTDDTFARSSFFSVIAAAADAHANAPSTNEASSSLGAGRSAATPCERVPHNDYRTMRPSGTGFICYDAAALTVVLILYAREQRLHQCFGGQQRASRRRELLSARA